MTRVCVSERNDLENGSADFDVQYIKLTGNIPGVSWATLFSEKKILKGQKTSKNGATWLFFEKIHFQSKILSRKSENVLGQLMSYE